MFFIILVVFTTGVIAGLMNLFMVIGVTNALILVLSMMITIMILNKLCWEEETIESILEEETRSKNEKKI